MCLLALQLWVLW